MVISKKKKDENFSLTQSGLPNSVYTGVVIWYKEKLHKFTEVTTVHMMKLTDEEIMGYIQTGEYKWVSICNFSCLLIDDSNCLCYRGKAGSYGIQGIASTFVSRIEGDGNNVIGLPLCRLCFELKRILNEN